MITVTAEEKELKALLEERDGLTLRIEEIRRKIKDQESPYFKYVGKFVRYRITKEDAYDSYNDGTCIFVKSLEKGGGSTSTVFHGVVVSPYFKTIKNRDMFYLSDSYSDLDDDGEISFTVEEITKEEFDNEINNIIAGIYDVIANPDKDDRNKDDDGK